MKFEQFPQQPSQEPVMPEPIEYKKHTEREGMSLDLAKTGRETLERVAENSENLNDILIRAIDALRKTNPTLAEQLEDERVGVYV